MNFQDIPKFTSYGNYQINLGWADIDSWVYRQHYGKQLDLDPDFQRGHVWSEDQQRAYVEFILRGGAGSKTLSFNCVGWMDDFRGPFELVDGKQRLTAVKKFLNNELLIFDGLKFSDFTGHLPHYAEFLILVNNLPSRKDVLSWYLEMNSGGVVHTTEELDRVREMLI